MGEEYFELYDGERYSLDKASTEAVRVNELAGTDASAKEYQLASNIATARLEKDEAEHLKNKIPGTEQVLSWEKPFRECVQYLPESYPITTEKLRSRLDPSFVDKMVWDQMKVWEDRQTRYPEYKKEAGRKSQVVKSVLEKLDKELGQDYTFKSAEDLDLCLTLIFEEEKDNLKKDKERSAILEDPARVNQRREILSQEPALVEQAAFKWATKSIIEFENEQRKEGIFNRHHWILGQAYDQKITRVKAETVCTCCGQRLTKTDSNQTEISGHPPATEWKAEPLSGFPYNRNLLEGNPHTWRSVLKGYTETKHHSEVLGKYDGVYRTAGVTTAGDKVLQDMNGNLFLAVGKALAYSNGKVYGTEFLLTSTTRESADTLLQPEKYFSFKDFSGHNTLPHKIAVLTPDNPPLDVIELNANKREGLKERYLPKEESTDQRLPGNLTREGLSRLLDSAKKTEAAGTDNIQKVLEGIGCPQEVQPHAVRAYLYFSGEAPGKDESSPYFLGKNRNGLSTYTKSSQWYQDLPESVSLALEMAILCHPNYRGRADKLMLLYPNNYSSTPEELAEITKTGRDIFVLHPPFEGVGYLIGPGGMWLKGFKRAIEYIGGYKSNVNVAEYKPNSYTVENERYLLSEGQKRFEKLLRLSIV